MSEEQRCRHCKGPLTQGFCDDSPCFYARASASQMWVDLLRPTIAKELRKYGEWGNVPVGVPF